MNPFFTLLTLGLTLSVSLPAFGDFPIRQSTNWDAGCVIAYNSTNHEYLVVWQELIPFGQLYLFGPVMGQRVKEDGTFLGNAFTIFSMGTLPSVAYNSQTNEYLVVASWSGLQGQRLSNTGTLIGSSVQLMTEAAWPRILYNSVTGNYLLAGAVLVENPPGSSSYNIQVFTRKVGADGQPSGTSQKVEDAPYGGYQLGVERFAVAYAPITSTESPYGRYLLAVQGNVGLLLTLLDSDGSAINAVYNPQSNTYFRYVPFKTGSNVGGEYNVDVAFGYESGYSMQGAAFLVVWGDNNNTWQNQAWTGIWGGFVDAQKLIYLSTDPVPNNAFPISAIYAHWAYSTYAESWKPKAVYNAIANKYMVAWRETPGPEPQNDTQVNHIRANRAFVQIPPPTNIVLSATSGNEDPKNPAIAASTINPNALVAWEDYRNLAATNWDIYGSLYTISAAPGPAGFVVTNIADSGPGSLRQALLDANAKAGTDTITFNIPGAGPHTIQPTSALPTITDPVVIDGYTQPGASPNTNSITMGSNAILRIELNGTSAGAGANGLRIAGGNSTVRGLVINRFYHGIELSGPGSTGNVVQGNYIGTDVTGNAALPNAGNGVLIVAGALANTIGGTVGSARNIISGNIQAGVSVVGGLMPPLTSGNFVQGNYLGTNAAGTAALANGTSGVLIVDSDTNTIGGATAGARNIISGNSQHGIHVATSMEVATDNVIQGNLIGVNAAGSAALANGMHGVFIAGSSNNVIGGTSGTPGAPPGNVISGNGGHGIAILGSGATGNRVRGNFIGGNSMDGVSIYQAPGNTIGGHSEMRNVIAGNSGDGVDIFGSSATGNQVQGNLIGTDVSGTVDLGNSGSGVLVQDAGPNTIGGPDPELGNTIAFNGGDGVAVLVTTAVSVQKAILGNSIFANAGLGIDLGGDGVTTNDPGDGDTGPNNLQNFPVLTGAESDGGFTFIQQVALNSAPNTSFRFEFFSSASCDPSGYGEGQTFLGWTTATTDASGNADFNVTFGGVAVPAGHVITATATDPSGNTSEFSKCIAVATPQNTQAGSNVQVNLGNGVNVTFDNVTGAGSTTLTTSTSGPPPPGGFSVVPSGSPAYYSIYTTATFTGNVKVCVQYYDGGLTPAQEATLKLQVYQVPPGQWQDVTSSLDVSNNIICGTVNHLSEFAVMVPTGGTPGHFVFTANTGESYSIVIDNATLDGNPLQVGDEIGVFTPAGLCAGASVWDGNKPLALTAWGDDIQTQVVDGYKSGEKMSFKVWDASAGTTGDYSAAATYSVGSGNFGDGAYTRISLLAAVTSVTQVVALSQGWSWISFRAQPADLAMPSVMGSVSNLVIVVNGAGQFYIPNVINSIGQMNILEGYKVYVSASSQVSVNGSPVSTTTPISLVAGWNFVSYLPTAAMSVQSALASVLSQLVIAKNDEGKFFIPNVINSLGNMISGKGYKLYLKANATLTYPQSSSSTKASLLAAATQDLALRHFQFRRRTAESYSVLVQSLRVEGKEPKIGDEVGIFTPSGLCVGAGVCDGSGVLGIAAWADDDRTAEVDGFRREEEIFFRFWDADKREEVPLTASFRTGNGKFGWGAYAAADLQSETVPATFALEQNHPNPFNAGTAISYALPKAERVLLKVYNVLGESVRTLVDEHKGAGKHVVYWDGLDDSGRSIASGIYMYRLTAGSFSLARKAVVLK